MRDGCYCHVPSIFWGGPARHQTHPQSKHGCRTWTAQRRLYSHHCAFVLPSSTLQPGIAQCASHRARRPDRNHRPQPRGWQTDVGITSMPIHHRLIRTQELLTEPLLVASAKENDFISSASIHVKELDDFPFIALSEMHCLGEQIQSFCHRQDLELKIVCDTSQLTTVKNCVEIGLGVSLVPRALATSDHSDRINYRPLSGASPQRKIAAATHAERTPSLLAKRFIEIVREEYPV